MKIKQTMRTVTASLFVMFGLLFTSLPLVGPVNTVSAAECDQSKGNCCGGVSTSIISCSETGESGDVKDTGLWAILVIAINILIAGVGVLALAGIVYGAVLYTSAGGNAEQVKKAMAIFTNVVIGVIAFGGMWVLLNFLIPGGAFTNL